MFTLMACLKCIFRKSLNTKGKLALACHVHPDVFQWQKPTNSGRDVQSRHHNRRCSAAFNIPGFIPSLPFKCQ